MTARRITAVLLVACLILPALMYLRDRGSSPPPPTRGQARFDARRVLASIAPNCGAGCHVDVLGTSAAHSWRVRLSAGTWRACYDVYPSAFRYSTDRGFSGVKSTPCHI